MPRRRIRALSLWALGILLGLGILGLGAAWLVGGTLIAAAPCAAGPLPAGLEGREVAFPSSGGGMCRGWYLPGRTGQGAVLLLHGVRGSRRDMVERARLLCQQGYAVLLYDLPAHGESAGESISFGYHEAESVAPAIRLLRTMAPGERVGVIATSMGAAALVMAPRDPEVQAVVLEAMFPTLRQAMEHRLGLRLGAWSSCLAPLLTLQLRFRLGFGVDDLRPIDHLEGLHAPVLFLAGDADRRTPADEVAALFAQANAPKELCLFPGAGHVDLCAADRERYERSVLAFLARHLRGQR